MINYEETRRVNLQKPKTSSQKDNEGVLGEPWRGLPEGLEEFTDDLVDERVPEHINAPSSCSRELLSEPRAKEVSSKHSIFSHFPKDPNCDICLRTKITRILVEAALVQSYPKRTNWQFDYCG